MPRPACPGNSPEFRGIFRIGAFSKGADSGVRPISSQANSRANCPPGCQKGSILNLRPEHPASLKTMKFRSFLDFSVLQTGFGFPFPEVAKRSQLSGRLASFFGAPAGSRQAPGIPALRISGISQEIRRLVLADTEENSPTPPRTWCVG